MAKKTKNERNAKGTKYCADLASTKALDKASETGIQAQCIALENASEKSVENFKKLAPKKYVVVDLNENGIFAKIKKGGKFITTDGIQFTTYTEKMIENAGKERDETDVYLPQLDERKLVGSISSLRKRIESARKKMVKLGLI